MKYDTNQSLGKTKPQDWKNEAYWRLPENVRHAIDVAKMKTKHSDFWYRLQTMNDKIYVYRSIYYGNMPQYQLSFLEKKRKTLEDRLETEKAEFEKEMNIMNQKLKRKIKRNKNRNSTAPAENAYENFVMEISKGKGPTT